MSIPSKRLTPSFIEESKRRASSYERTIAPFNPSLDHDVYRRNRFSYVKAIAVFNPELSEALERSFSEIGSTPSDSFRDIQSKKINTIDAVELSLDASRLELARSLYKNGALSLKELTKHFGFSAEEIKR